MDAVPTQPRSMGRTVLLYLGLVGIPAIGVAGIVRVGGAITPPVSVGGRWALAADAAGIPDLAKASDGAAPALTIVQSGVKLAVSLGDGGPSTTTATLEGSRLRAALARDGQARLAIDAVVSKDGSARYLSGELRRIDCPTCPAVPFSAQRVAGPHG